MCFLSKRDTFFKVVLVILCFIQKWVLSDAFLFLFPSQRQFLPFFLKTSSIVFFTTIVISAENWESCALPKTCFGSYNIVSFLQTTVTPISFYNPKLVPSKWHDFITQIELLCLFSIYFIFGWVSIGLIKYFVKNGNQAVNYLVTNLGFVLPNPRREISSLFLKWTIYLLGNGELVVGWMF